MTLLDAYYEKVFESEFVRAKGDTFQTFFERLMGLAYKADFMACRPWGGEGDHKNDGFLRSERRLFQVYAPIEMTEAKAKAKITEDFVGARAYWGKNFDKWVFVHNAAGGLPPHVHKLLLDFEANNPGVTLETWGLEELRLIFRKLSDEDKFSWFGPAPDEETRNRVGFADLRAVLERIEASPVPLNAEVRDVPAGKVEANALSEAATQLLKEGFVKAPLVDEFLNQWHDETLGERLAGAFRAEYLRLRELYTPTEVFSALQEWAGGTRRGTPEHELAVLSVIAYYFERCDIYEEPRGVSQ